MRYEVWDEPKYAQSNTVGHIISSGKNLKSVLAAANIYVAKEWADRTKIEVRINGNSPYKTSAVYMRMYRRKVLVSSFKRQIVLLSYR